MEEKRAHICPECGAQATLLSQRFKPPKKEDKAAWEVVRFLVQAGFRYHGVWHMIRPGMYLRQGAYPKSMRDAKFFVAQWGAKLENRS